MEKILLQIAIDLSMNHFKLRWDPLVSYSRLN